ncbi:MAG: GldG family protein [Spirochaetaceae bacterium]|nr:GldG family protein [Spirochaetaceae bacterium]
MTEKQCTLITVLTVAALVLGLLVSGRLWFRLDLTKSRAYTMSRASRTIRAEIPDRVQITYYLSDKLAAMYPQPGEITDFLREYAAYSRGKIRLTVRDPVKAGLTGAVQELGIRPTQLRITEEAEATSALVYTGITVEYLDKVEVLPLVFSLETLEYDITSRIRALVREVKREVGVIVGDGTKQWAADYEYLNLMLVQGGFEVRVIPPGDEIPDTLPALFVLGGAEDLDEWALYRIDRYIQGGGNALFAVSAVSVNVQTSEAAALADGGLLSMLSRYGVSVKSALVMDKAALLLTYQVPTPFGIPIQQQVRYPHWVEVLNGSKDHPLTANFGGVELFWPNPLELSPPEGVEAQALFTSTEEAWLMTKDFAIAPQTASYLFEGEAPDTKGVKVLGAVLTGVFPGYFAGQPKPVREGSGEELPAMPPAPRKARVMVIGNTEMAANVSYAYTSRVSDLNFLVSAAGWLGDDEDIIAIRTRQGLGQLNKITDPRKRLRAEVFAQGINVAVVPLSLVIAGLVAARRRRRLRRF